MECAKCGQANPAEALFCMKCGTRLGAKCPGCGAEYSAEASFCIKCGAKLADATSGVSVPTLEDMKAQLDGLIPYALTQKYRSAELQYKGENRLLTALFADISGFTSLSGTKTSEYMFQLVQSCFRRLVGIVANYEGIVSGFRGDGILALFGAPILHENDAERAILTALDMVADMQSQQLKVSVGISTARMTVGEIYTQLHSEYTAYGSEINLAKRLQEMAEPGQILVAASSYRLTRRSFDFETLLPLDVRGFLQPAEAYAVQRVKVHPEKIRGIEGLRAKLIGREQELAILKQCVHDLLAGNGRMVSVIGEAGVGKSRLVSELSGYIESMQEEKSLDLKSQASSPISVLGGRCVSIGQSISYSVFIDVLKKYLEFSDEDGANEIKEKTVDGMRKILPQRWEDVVPYIGHLLSVKSSKEWDEKVGQLTPEQLRYQTFLALRDVFLALANQRPLLLVLDDLHWADNLSLDLVSLLIDDLPNAPLMLVCIYRPVKERRIWQIGTKASEKFPDRYRSITLRSLSVQQSERLIESLLGAEDLPETLKKNILDKAGGNPFFVEEVIRSLMESGIVYMDGERWVAKGGLEEFAVPNTVESVIMARVDRLEEDVCYVLQCASVIGKVFRHRLLQYITQRRELDSYLKQLEDGGFIYEERAIPELEYSFRHVLIQETLYQTPLLEYRQVMHQLVGEGIEEIYGDRIEEFYEELAWHYSQCDYSSKAIEYSMKAGNKAKAMHANQEAIRYFENALEFIQAQPASDEQLSLEIAAREALGDVLFTTGVHHRAEAQFQKALDLASEHQDVQRLAHLTHKLADSIHWQDKFDQAIEVTEPGLALLGDQVCSPEAANLLEVIIRSCWAKNDWESVHLYVDRLAQVIHQVPYFDSIYKIYYSLFYCRMMAGELQAANEWLEEMEHVCLEHSNESGLARCYHGMGDLYAYQRDLEQASRWLEKSLVFCERTGEAHFLLEGHLELASYLVLLDRDTSVIEEHIQKGMEVADRMAGMSQVASASSMCGTVGDAYLQKGNPQKAMYFFRRAIEFGGETDVLLAHLLHKLEQLYVQQDQHEEFFVFCQQAREKANSGTQSPLRYWHIEPITLAFDHYQLAWRDPFQGPSLLGKWDWIDPESKSSYNFSQGGVLEIQTLAGRDFFSQDLNAPRLLRQVSGDFAVETSLVDITEEEHQNGGLLLWASEEMYLSFEKRLTGINEVRLRICRKNQYEIIGRGWLEGRRLYLRLERTGSLVSALCSNDGKQWYICGEVSFPVNDPVWVGLCTACPGGSDSSASILRFHEFELFQRKAG
jgi:class 3 adenylate cyclase/tetratricopeptide (TPR) repeat protein/regulation of enolase protein 1 (concanavalin A-like superfamily)/energy-coupling factor transporter ATP-binding protein EcfA2